MQTITRKCTFDSAHRVMNEKMKCFNLHCHTYLAEITFGYHDTMDIGYAIDFKEIKRIGLQWIDDMLDHAIILNPHDAQVIELAKKLDSKMWIMSLNAQGYCNPTVENIAKEILLAMSILFLDDPYIWIESIRLYETPNCYTDCRLEDTSVNERHNFTEANYDHIRLYANKKGRIEYDDRKE